MNDDEYIAYLNREGAANGAQIAKEEVTNSRAISVAVTSNKNQEASFHLD